MSQNQKCSLLNSIALVIGTMVGAGILLIPRIILPYGKYGLIGWIIASICGVSLAYSFAQMSVIKAKQGKSQGLSAYSQQAFGNTVGFYVGWIHWIGLCFGFSSVTLAFTDYLYALIYAFPSISSFFPIYTKAYCAIGIIIAMALLNIFFTSAGLSVLSYLTGIKVTLFIIVIIASITRFEMSKILIDSQTSGVVSNIFAAAQFALLAFAGVEGAVVAGNNTENPERTIPLATMIGTAIAASLFCLTHLGIMVTLPVEQQLTSTAPVADTAKILLGEYGLMTISFMAVLGTLGSINALMILTATVFKNLMDEHNMSKILRTTSSAGFPLFGCMLSSLIVIKLLYARYVLKIDLSTIMSTATFLFLFSYFYTITALYKEKNYNFTIWCIAMAGIATLMLGCEPICVSITVLLLFIGHLIYTICQQSE